jgi:hypothetical protein
MTITALAKDHRLRANRSRKQSGFVRCSTAAITIAASVGEETKKGSCNKIGQLALGTRGHIATEVLDRLPTTKKSPEKAAENISWPVCDQFLIGKCGNVRSGSPDGRWPGHRYAGRFSVEQTDNNLWNEKL